jgi:hypothetical protein
MLATGRSRLINGPLIETAMKDPQLDAVAGEVKKLAARMGALEKLLERILRQKPVSEKQLDQVLRSRGVTHPGR